MKKEFSLYLDLVRFVAAILVVLFHAKMPALTTGDLPFSGHGHAAVIVFYPAM